MNPQPRPGGRCAAVVATCLVVLLVAGVSACGADDRDMRPPSASQTTTTAPAVVAPSDAVGTGTQLALQMSSSAFESGTPIPDQYTCRGRDVSPPLQWANLPAGVTELAVVVVDLDAGGFVHWTVTGISPTVGGLEEGQLPEGAVAGPNAFGSTGWRGPCPPEGQHTYEFRLIALSAAPSLPTGIEAQQAVNRIVALPSLAVATITGTFTA